MTTPDPIDTVFERKAPSVRALYDQLINAMRNFGGFTEVPKSDYILLKKNSNFAGIYPRKNHLNLEFIVNYPIVDPHTVKELQLSARRFAYTVKIEVSADVDAQVLEWLKDAYESCK